MNNQNTRFWWIALPFLFIATVGVTLSLAKDGQDDRDDDDNKHVDTIGMATTFMPPSANDSLFALINGGFQTIKPALERSCFDCHSNKTKFPWYYEFPIIKGMIDDDIKEAREKVDFSKDFPFTGKGSQAEMLSEIRDEIAEGKMPLCSYRLTHWGRLIEGPMQDTVFA